MALLQNVLKTGNTHLALALMRIWLGIMLMYHGGLKLFVNQAPFIEHVTVKLQLPEPFAWLAIAAEFGGGALLILGLFTRVASIFSIATMCVAIFGTHYLDPWARKELAVWYLSSSIVFFIAGGGMYSMDAKLSERS